MQFAQQCNLTNLFMTENPLSLYLGCVSLSERAHPPQKSFSAALLAQGRVPGIIPSPDLWNGLAGLAGQVLCVSGVLKDSWQSSGMSEGC